ncbi:hypothetical protein CYMTET_40365, partial [Cymbomonas tetramitiformis]
MRFACKMSACTSSNLVVQHCKAREELARTHRQPKKIAQASTRASTFRGVTSWFQPESALRRTSLRLRLSPKRAMAPVAGEVSQVPDDVRKKFTRLQNGSDVRGVALDGVEGEPVTLSCQEAYFIAAGFAEWLKGAVSHSDRLTVSVGQDSRLSGDALVEAILSGLASQGVAADGIGLATTPACFMSTIAPDHEYDGSIMVTASHLPWNRNGMKFFSAKGGLKKADIAVLLSNAMNNAASVGTPPSPDAAAAELIGSVDFMPCYCAHLIDLIRKGVNHPETYDKPLTGLKVIVDAGNGSGGFMASQVLAPLGADTTGSQFLDPDGNFPNHVPNPEDKQAMEMTTAAVLENKADLGIVFDTDVDRSGVVDSSGLEINKNRLIALLSAIVLKEYPGSTIVTDSVTNDGVSEFITAKGGEHYRYRRGYANVISKGKELNTQGTVSPLMIETSGHGAMKDNYFLDDGAYLAVQILIELVRQRLAGSGSLSDLLDGYKEAKEAREFRLKVTVEDFKPAGELVVEGFRELAVSGRHPWEMAAVNHEGYRVSIDEGEGRRGWILFRQ